jgi:hypothetical protein
MLSGCGETTTLRSQFTASSEAKNQTTLEADSTTKNPAISSEKDSTAKSPE